MAQPLTQLLKKEAFVWSPAADTAFVALKHALTKGPALQLPDFEQWFIINCDGSGSSFGAVLHQDNGPIAFYSRLVAPQHAKLAAYERELIGLVKAVKHCGRTCGCAPSSSALITTPSSTYWTSASRQSHSTLG